MTDPGLTAPSANPIGGIWRTTSGIVVCKVVANGAAAGVALLTARQLGPSGRGVVVLLLTLAGFISVVGSMGLNLASRIHLVALDGRMDPADYLGLSAVLTVAVGVLSVALGVVLLPLVDVHLSAAEQLLFGALAGSILAPFLLNAAINAFGFTARAAAVDAAGTVAQLLVTVALFVGGSRRVDAYIAAMVIGNVLQVGLALAALRPAIGSVRPRFQRSRWARVVRTGLPGIAVDLSGILTFRLDRYLLGLFLGPAAVGVYSVAATAPEILRLPALAMGQPIFHRLASGTAKVEDFGRTRVYCLLVTAALAASAFLVAPFAVRILFGSQYAGAVTPLRVLLLAEFGITLFYIDGALVAAAFSRLGDAAIAAVAGCLVVVVADLVLIPSHGVVGAAWGSVVAYSVTGLAAHGILRYRLRSRAPVR
ncbi:MAG TPA: oligosaccharide flippase family protein [Acidimicrobiales bacterium]|jgi:O-antigen/teichoic acid export membrane protein|nr:oligosaccharide flippase family protein [Acidimicrobiales bacterium]